MRDNMILYVSLFLYGLTTFISPCSIGLVSAYLTYTIKDAQSRSKGVIVGVSYVTAMSLVFFLFGYALSSLVPVNLATSKIFTIFAGGLMIFFGFNTIGFTNRIKVLQTFTNHLSDGSNTFRTKLMSQIGGRSDFVSAFMFGVVISIALGPCSLALVLPAVMMTLFNAPSAVHGGLQLLAFGFGHSLPVLILSVLISQTRYLLSRRLTQIGGKLSYLLGAGLVLLGLWLIIEAF